MKAAQVIRSMMLGTAMAMAIGVMAQPAPVQQMASNILSLQAEGLNNEMVSLADFQGKFILMDIWAPWSPVCKHHANTVKLIASKSERDNKVVVVKYALESDRDRWVESVSHYEASGNLVQVRDPMGHASPLVAQLGIVGPPYVLVFSPEGDLLYRGSHIDEAYRVLRKAVRRHH